MKKRLIDAYSCPELFDKEFKETRQLILQGETHLDNLAEGFTEAHRVIQSMPTIDAVEVVRCRDCRFYEQGVEYYHYDGIGTKDICRLYKRQMQEDDFCSYGERKE